MLPFPCPAAVYLSSAFKGGINELHPTYWRLFRVIPAKEYLRNFASDRSHMLKPAPKVGINSPLANEEREENNNIDDINPGASGNLLEDEQQLVPLNDIDASIEKRKLDEGYISPPPAYDCIINSLNESNTLPKYRAMPSYSEAVNAWEESQLKEVAVVVAREQQGRKEYFADIEMPYGVVLTQDAFVDFCTRAESV